MRMRYIVVCGLSGSAIFFHVVINGKIFEGGKKSLFSLQCLPETFPIQRRIEGDMIKMYIGLHVKYRLFLSDFGESKR